MCLVLYESSSQGLRLRTLNFQEPTPTIAEVSFSFVWSYTLWSAMYVVSIPAHNRWRCLPASVFVCGKCSLSFVFLFFSKRTLHTSSINTELFYYRTYILLTQKYTKILLTAHVCESWSSIPVQLNTSPSASINTSSEVPFKDIYCRPTYRMRNQGNDEENNKKMEPRLPIVDEQLETPNDASNSSSEANALPTESEVHEDYSQETNDLCCSTFNSMFSREDDEPKHNQITERSHDPTSPLGMNREMSRKELGPEYQQRGRFLVWPAALGMPWDHPS